MRTVASAEISKPIVGTVDGPDRYSRRSPGDGTQGPDRDVDRRRFGSQGRVTCNARMTSRQLRKYCALDPQSIELLKEAVINLNLSARAYDRILKVARTIADLAASPPIQSDHLAEAVQYRALDRSLW